MIASFSQRVFSEISDMFWKQNWNYNNLMPRGCSAAELNKYVRRSTPSLKQIQFVNYTSSNMSWFLVLSTPEIPRRLHRMIGMQFYRVSEKDMLFMDFPTCHPHLNTNKFWRNPPCFPAFCPWHTGLVLWKKIGREGRRAAAQGFLGWASLKGSRKSTAEVVA